MIFHRRHGYGKKEELVATKGKSALILMWWGTRMVGVKFLFGVTETERDAKKKEKNRSKREEGV